METTIYNFDQAASRRGTNCVKWDRVASDVLPMFIADMDFPTSPQVLTAIRRRLDHGILGYGFDPGLPGVLAEWFLREYGAAVEEDWIVLLPGVVPVLAAVSHIRKGRPMINTPNYSMLLSAPKRAGKETVLSPLKNTNEYYEMDFEDMQRRAAPDVDLFYLCNPHNPVGRVYTREELEGLSRFAKKNNMVVVSDEIHGELVFDRPHIPFFTVDDYAFQHSITILGPGKTYNIPGLPMGFAVIPNPVLREQFRKVTYGVGHPGVLNTIACGAAYGQSQEWKRQLAAYLKQNRNYLEGELRRRFPGAGLTHVEGTYLQWVDFRPCGLADPATWMKKEAKVFPSDGKDFGGEGYVRFNFGCPRDTLTQALDRIEESYIRRR